MDSHLRSAVCSAAPWHPCRQTDAEAPLWGQGAGLWDFTWVPYTARLISYADELRGNARKGTGLSHAKLQDGICLGVCD